MVTYYFDNDAPFRVSPRYIQPDQHPQHKITYLRTTHAFESVEELLKYPLNLEQLSNIYQIDIEEPQYYVQATNYGGHIITNLGQIPYQEIDYAKHLPQNHPLLIAKGIDKSDYEIHTSNETRLYALIQRGKPNLLEKISKFFKT